MFEYLEGPATVPARTMYALNVYENSFLRVTIETGNVVAGPAHNVYIETGVLDHAKRFSGYNDVSKAKFDSHYNTALELLQKTKSHE